MRKYAKLIFVVLSLAIISTTMVVPVLANGEIGVYLDNEKVQFDVAPLLVNGRTLVPMRAIFEKLGAVVYWDDNTRTAIAQKGNVNVSISIDDTTLYKNGEPIILDVPAQLNGGRTLVPLRAVSEAFDCDVQWDGTTQAVNISTYGSLSVVQESISKLINWVSENYNYTLPSGDKAYVYEIGNYEIQIIPSAKSKILTMNFHTSNNEERVGTSVWLLPNARFGGNYTYSVAKTYNSAEGDIIKANLSNHLDLNCDWYTGTYDGDKNVLLDKYKNNVNITLKLFDSFLKTNYVGLSLKDFNLEYDLSNVELNNQTTTDIPTPSTPQNNTPNNSYQGGGGYSTNTKINLSSFPLYLYADDGTGTFLGEISSNQYDRDSIANQYGDYGSQYKTKSIFNQYGDYGSQYSRYSVFNEYATNPPKILDKNGKVVGYLTANKYIKDAISYEEMMVLLKKFNK